MADKKVEIEVATTADLSQVEDLQSVLEDTETTAQNLGDMITDISGDNVSTVSSDFEEVENSADGASESVDNFQTSLDLIDSAALLSISGELSNIGSQAEGMSQEMNNAAISVGQLATQTGVAEPQMVSLINNISNATFPNDEAMMYVKSLDQMGVSADKFAESATNMDRINDAFGLGAARTNSLSQELGVLGVDMNNVSTAFNALAYANANTVGGMENYYTFLKRYDAQFNELGYDVDQASIIIAAATQKYGGGRAALSGLSSALKEADGDTRKLEEALGIQAGTLDNASAVTGQYSGQLEQLAKEEAEHKTILDQINAAWEDMSLSLSPVLAPMTSVMGLIGNAGSFAVGINGLVTLANSMRGLSVVTYAKAAADAVAAAAQWALNVAMSMNPIGILIIAIVALIAVLGYLYMNNEKVRAAVNALGQTFINVAQRAVSGFKNAINSIPQAIQRCLDWGYNVFMSHPIVQAAVWLGKAIANGFSALGLGQHSPGKIVKSMRQELDWTSDAITSSGLASDAARLGSNMSNAFSPDLSNNRGYGAGNVINLHVEVGSVDNDDRVSEIVEAIRRELAWNNATAGRAV